MKSPALFTILLLVTWQPVFCQEKDYDTFTFPNQSNTQVHVTMFAKKKSWGMGQQFYGMKIENLTSGKLHVKGHYYAKLTCGNETREKFDIRLKPNETLGGDAFVMDITGLTASADSKVCVGQPLYEGGKQVGVSRIVSVGFQFTEIKTEQEESAKPLPVTPQAVPGKKPANDNASKKSFEKESNVALAKEQVNGIRQEVADNRKTIDSLFHVLERYTDGATATETAQLKYRYTTFKEKYEKVYVKCYGELLNNQPASVNELQDVAFESNSLISDLNTTLELAKSRKPAKSSSGIGGVIADNMDAVGDVIAGFRKIGRQRKFDIEDGYIGLTATWETYLNSANAPYKAGINIGIPFGSTFGGSTFLYELKGALSFNLQPNKDWAAGVFEKNAQSITTIKSGIAIGAKLSPMLILVNNGDFSVTLGPSAGFTYLNFPEITADQYTKYQYNDINTDKVFWTYGGQVVAFLGGSWSIRAEYTNAFSNTIHPGIHTTGSQRVALPGRKVNMGIFAAGLGFRLFQNN